MRGSVADQKQPRQPELLVSVLGNIVFEVEWVTNDGKCLDGGHGHHCRCELVSIRESIYIIVAAFLNEVQVAL